MVSTTRSEVIHYNEIAQIKNEIIQIDFWKIWPISTINDKTSLDNDFQNQWLLRNTKKSTTGFLNESENFNIEFSKYARRSKKHREKNSNKARAYVCRRNTYYTCGTRILHWRFILEGSRSVFERSILISNHPKCWSFYKSVFAPVEISRNRENLFSLTGLFDHVLFIT